MALKWFKKNKEKREPADVESVPASEMGFDGDTDGDSDCGELEDVPEDTAEAEPEPLADEKKNGGLFARLKSGLSKTRAILTTDIDELFLGKKVVDEDMLEALEERLITADMGVSTTMDIMARISKKRSRISGAGELRKALKEEILAYFEALPESPAVSAKPHVVMVVGVNGVGKTTTIGKLAAHESAQGKKVLIAAADTFRAAAIEQIAIWAERTGSDIVRHKDNADPAAVAFDGIDAAVARGVDTVFVDTAGRLHTKVNLMEEIKKIRRALAKRMPDAPHEVLLVLDATTGQNALSQAKLFDESLGITGLALTKLDGTAKGGIVVSICKELNIPLKYIGVGEGVDDLQVFDPDKFVNALF